MGVLGWMKSSGGLGRRKGEMPFGTSGFDILFRRVALRIGMSCTKSLFAFPGEGKSQERQHRSRTADST